MCIRDRVHPSLPVFCRQLLGHLRAQDVRQDTYHAVSYTHLDVYKRQAWDGEKLVGLISVMDDGIMTAYIHYLLVNPDYQYKGIRKELLERVLETYQSYLRISLIANGNNAGFYENCGFKMDKTGIPMHITSLLE